MSNSLRVVKTYRQVNERRVGYVEAAEAIIEREGLRGLFGRGLKTRILANGLQGLMFSILWKLFMDMWVFFFLGNVDGIADDVMLSRWNDSTK